MDVRLIIEKGQTRQRELHLRAVQTTVGRQKGCGLRIPSSQVSRRHCVLIVQHGYLAVEDLDSVNGTLLNGQRVVGRQVVRPGDRLEIGPLRFVVQYHLSHDAVKRLRQAGGAAPVAAEEAEELDVLPLAEAEAEDAEVEALEALPEVEDIPEADLADEEEVLEPIAVDDDEEVQPATEDWSLPESNELRDILEQMEGEKPGRSPKPKKR
jgi:pSer/pThr/pTyr-binding forkhead associated (FHA) protein